MVNYKHTGLARKQKGKKTTRNGGFFALPVWGVYTWRGLFSEFYGISAISSSESSVHFNQAIFPKFTHT